jgi:hypothetical protein
VFKVEVHKSYFHSLNIPTGPPKFLVPLFVSEPEIKQDKQIKMMRNESEGDAVCVRWKEETR